ncbi:hypothetical protein BDC45DRAFT_327037 [Circinella umbellata]|nr:hypothetical protein BDC45DRAFT_327037 [Circinella umbellata]
MDSTELESLKARIHAFRTEYQKTMACCKKDEQVAWQQLCDTLFKHFGQTYYSSHYNLLIQKINEFKDHLNNYLLNREQHEWVEERCTINDLLRQKHSIPSLEKRHNTRIYYLKQNIQQELKDKQQLYHDEQNKSLEESQQLYNYVKKRLSIEIKKLVPPIGDDVVRALCQQVIEEHQINEQQKMECVTSGAITQLERHRQSQLQHIIKEQQENLNSIEETIKLRNKLKEAQIKVKEIEKECSGEKFETMNDIQIKVEFLEQKVHEVLQRTKRLREEEILVTSERKKNRLEDVEKNLDQLQTTVNQAKQDVLLPSFPLRIKQSIHEIYGVLK